MTEQQTQTPENQEKPPQKELKSTWEPIVLTVFSVFLIAGVAWGAMAIVNNSSKKDEEKVYSIKNEVQEETPSENEDEEIPEEEEEETPTKNIEPKKSQSSVVTNMTETEFKQSCEDREGTYNPPSIFYGVGPVPQPSWCGFNEAPDAGELCYSEDKPAPNTCSKCTYEASCGLAAGDFGPEQCHCGNYEIYETLEEPTEEQ